MGLASRPPPQPRRRSPAAAGQAVQPGQTCTAADLGTRHPVIKTTEVTPTITHFKGWYVTQGSTVQPYRHHQHPDHHRGV